MEKLRYVLAIWGLKCYGSGAQFKYYMNGKSGGNASHSTNLPRLVDKPQSPFSFATRDINWQDVLHYGNYVATPNGVFNTWTSKAQKVGMANIEGMVGDCLVYYYTFRIVHCPKETASSPSS